MQKRCTIRLSYVSQVTRNSAPLRRNRDRHWTNTKYGGPHSWLSIAVEELAKASTSFFCASRARDSSSRPVRANKQDTFLVDGCLGNELPHRDLQCVGRLSLLPFIEKRNKYQSTGWVKISKRWWWRSTGCHFKTDLTSWSRRPFPSSRRAPAQCISPELAPSLVTYCALCQVGLLLIINKRLPMYLNGLSSFMSWFKHVSTTLDVQLLTFWGW